MNSLISGIKSKTSTVTPQEAHRIMNDEADYVLLDVRTPGEYKQRHINGAKLIPLDELGRRAAAELPDKQTTVLIYCQSGARAARAAKMLTEMGYTGVLSFGGIMKWPYDTVTG